MSSPQQSDRLPARLVAAGVVVGLIVLAAIGLIVAKFFDHSDSNKPKAHAEHHKSHKNQASTSACGLPEGDQSIPTKAPKTEWKLYGGMAVATSKVYGPGKTSHGFGNCFAHNPTGALFATANFATGPTLPGVTPQMKLTLFYRDKHYPAFAKYAKTTKPNSSGSAQNKGLQIAGFRMGDCTRNRVQVEMALKVVEGPNTGAIESVTTTVAWQRGDWRIVLPPSGTPPMNSLDSLQGFTKWKGI